VAPGNQPIADTASITNPGKGERTLKGLRDTTTPVDAPPYDSERDKNEKQTRELFDGGPPIRLLRFISLAKPGERRVWRRAVLVGLICWAPIAALALAREAIMHDGSARTLFGDFAIYARFLIATPLFILAEVDCMPRLGAIVRHFVDGKLVTDIDRPRFERAVDSTRRFLDSTVGEVGVLALTYLALAILAISVPPRQYPAWFEMTGGRLSAAAWWHTLVSVPILLAVFFGWLFRLLLWSRFLWLMSRLKLLLIPSHPDHCGGLRFVSASIRGFRLLAFAMGTLAAGMTANRVIHEGVSPFVFKSTGFGLMAVVVVLFAGPLTIFIPRLREAKKRGIFRYGALAGFVGWQFEQKWLDPDGGIDEKALGVGDFSATTDLFAVVSNVYEMQDVPFGFREVALLAVAALIPFVLVAILALPFNVVLNEVAKMLF